MTIDPIVLTAYGETLEAYPQTKKTDPEKYKLISCIGVHSICNGWMDHKEVSPTHVALCCYSCHLRIVIPKEVDTWAKLQEHMERVLDEKKIPRVVVMKSL